MKETDQSDFSVDPEAYGGYTAKEIYTLWRGARNPDYEIKILSQLCGCSKIKIIGVLNCMRNDADPPLPNYGARFAEYDLYDYPECNGLPETTKYAIIDDFRTGTSLELIAEKRAVSYSSVYRILRESGVLKGRCSRRINQAVKDRIAEDYIARMPIISISEKRGVSRGTVYKILKEKHLI